jgi:hypothetical protein
MMGVVSDMLDDLLLYQALENPKKSAELHDFIQDVFHSEAQQLFREHNEAIQMQQNRILQLTKEVQRLQTMQSRMHADHASEVQALHKSYTNKLLEENLRHATEVQAFYRNSIEKLKNPL